MDEHTNDLLARLADPDHNVRGRAALALGELGDPETACGLVKTLVEERDVFVRENITWALARLGEAAVPDLVALIHDTSPMARHNVAHALGKIADHRAVTPLLSVLRDEDALVVSKAVSALSQIGDSRAIPALIGALCRQESEVGSALLLALESYGESVVPPLIAAFDSEDAVVRERVVLVLGQITTPAAVQTLLRALVDSAWQVRVAAAQGLAASGDASAIAALQGAIADEDFRVRTLIERLLRDERTPRRAMRRTKVGWLR